MLDILLLIRLIAAFAVGSIWVAAVTVITEKKGSKYGFLGGIPSTAAFSLLFIGLNQSSAAAVEATTVLPIIFCISNAFLLLYAYTAQRGFMLGISVSLLVWFGFAALIVASGFNEYAFSLGVAAVVSALTFFAFAKLLKLTDFGGRTGVYRKGDVAVRAAGAGALVAASVLLSQVGGPIIGGIAAAFPAVYTSTLIILNRSQGLEFSRSTARSMAYGGILCVIPYSVAVRFLYPAAGIWLGTLFAYLLVAPLAAIAYFISAPKRK